MYCDNCKQETQVGDRFCNHCGHQIQADKVQKKISKKVIIGIAVVSSIALVSLVILIVKLYGDFTGKVSEIADEKLENEMTEVMETPKEDSFEVLPVDYIIYPDADSGEEQIIEAVNYEMIVTGFYPTIGTLGSIITIEGENFADVEEVMIGDYSMPIRNMDANHVYVVITSTLEAGNYPVVVKTDSQMYEVGMFEVALSIHYEILAEEITDVQEQYYVETEDMNIYIPAGALNEPGELIVRQIANVDDGVFVDGTSGVDFYSLTIGDQHEFNDRISFAIDLPLDYGNSGKTPLVMSFNEETGLWDSVFSEITEANKLAIRTDHFSTFAIFWNYTKYTNGNGYFAIYYISEDIVKVPGIETMDQLAIKSEQILMDAVRIYDSVLGEDYHYPKTFLGVSHNVVLSSSYNTAGPYYSPVTDCIFLATSYKSEESFHTTIAHELFHGYQNLGKNAFAMNRQKWLTEAMAEYAGDRVYYGIPSTIWAETIPSIKISHVDGGHEYSMSAFLDHIIEVNQLDFVDLFKIYVSDDSSDSIGVLDEFLSIVESNTDKEYRDFWAKALTSNEPLRTDFPVESLVTGSYGISFRAVSHVFKEVDPTYDYCQNYVAYHLRADKENVPVRYIKVVEESPKEVRAIKLENEVELKVSVATDLFNSIMLSAMNDHNKAWNKIDGNEDVFELDNNDILLIGAFDKGKYNIHVKEVDAVAVTKSLVVSELNEKVEIEFGFSKIFDECVSVTIETYFGDGEMDSKDYNQKKTINLHYEHVYKTFPTENIEAHLYDTSDGKKELIGKLIIPLLNDAKVEVEANKYYPETNEEVFFIVNVEDEAYTYGWDFGDGSEVIVDHNSRKSYTFSDGFDYRVKVTVYDENDMFVGVGECLVEVVGSEDSDPIGNDRVYIPVATPEEIMDLSASVSLETLVNRVFGLPLIDVEPYYDYNTNGKLSSIRYDQEDSDSGHTIMIFADYMEDGSMTYMTVSELVNIDGINVRYNVDVSFDRDSKLIDKYYGSVKSVDISSSIHGFNALYKDGVLVRRIYGEMGIPTGTGYTYYDSGVVQTEIQYSYEDNALLMHEFTYYEEGGMKKDANYRSEKFGHILPGDYEEHGIAIHYSPSGIKTYVEEHSNGKKVGVHISYDHETGVLDYETYYDDNGDKTKFIVYLPSGEVSHVDVFGD